MNLYMMKLQSLCVGAFVLAGLCFQSVSAEQLCQSDAITSTTPIKQFVIGEGVVTDGKTGLMWQRCFLGATGADCSSGDALKISWVGAFQKIEEINKAQMLGFSDWRMPNIRELQTIAELQCVEPALNLDLFPSALGQRTWSASPYAFYPHYSWFVDFKHFEVTYQERYNRHLVLLVRDVE